MVKLALPSNELDINDPNYDKKTKLYSCINLIRTSLKEDNTYLEGIVNNIKSKSRDKVLDTFLVKTVLNCYTSISFIKSAELLSKEKINPFTKDNKPLLDLEHYATRYNGDEKQLEKDTVNLRELFGNSKEQVCV
jgi:hypothetical protein